MLEQKVHELLAKETLETYRREAELYRHFPKPTLRRRVALLFKRWAEALEPGLKSGVFAGKQTHA
ncbi:MAG: hypothetical protein SFU83_03575 [Meiothermus sp.]|nr:hypothetical protein [Meiothermus sp.]